MAEATLVLDGPVMRVTGPITFNTVRPLLARGRELLSGMPPAGTLDLSTVSRVDSAGVALLVEFWRLRVLQGARLGFTGIPPELMPLLQLYRLDAVLGLVSEA